MAFTPWSRSLNSVVVELQSAIHASMEMRYGSVIIFINDLVLCDRRAQEIRERWRYKDATILLADYEVIEGTEIQKR